MVIALLTSTLCHVRNEEHLEMGHFYSPLPSNTNVDNWIKDNKKTGCLLDSWSEAYLISSKIITKKGKNNDEKKWM